jgi:predicted ATP-grasp superfamily ATP-dependent carboligase
MLLPTNDESLEVLSRHRERLSRWYHVAAAPWEVTRQLLHKDRFETVARQAGVALPRSWGLAEPGSAERPDLTFPLLVKPVESSRFARRFDRKLFVANDREELAAQLRLIEATGLTCQLFDWIPGGDDHLYVYGVYMDARGEPVGGVAIHKLRSSPPLYGVGRVAEVVDEDSMREPTVEILRRIGFRGIAAAEFKRDPRDGSWRILEINGRLSLMQGPARRAGFDFPAMAWQDLVLGQRIEVEPNGWRGCWIHLHADLLYGAFQRKLERLSWKQFRAPYRRSHSFAVWSRRDPGPFLAQWSRTAREAVTLPFRPAGRRALKGGDQAALGSGSGGAEIARAESRL